MRGRADPIAAPEPTEPLDDVLSSIKEATTAQG